jgi:hypothetical protein
MAPARRFTARSSVPAVVGSHQSEADVQAMMPEQHAVTAAAAAKKSGTQPANARAPASAQKAPNGPKLFKFKTHAAKVAGRRRQTNGSKAYFSLTMAQYQKGELVGVDTGNIFAGVKPRYGNNEKFKAALLKWLLKEKVRWNDELKHYRVKARAQANQTHTQPSHCSLTP